MGDVFLSYIPPEDTVFSQGTYHARRGTRAFASDILRSGKKDLVVGAYSGEVFLVPNAGSSQAPAFKQPPDVAKTAIPTTKDAVTRWGNVFSPVTWDWNKDGKDDIILGEGSYSANNIHLLINQGTGSKPVFDENNRTVIAFGDGLEQLSPCVVDYNGDGQPDLLVSERSGRVALYLNKGATAQRGEPQPEIPFASFLTTSSGGELKFDGISVITTADLNSDGLFDLIVGKANGRIAICYNEGTKDNPKFKPPVELKAEKPTPSFAVPSAWEIDYGLLRGNYYARLSIVTAEEDEKAEPPEGKSCLRVDYMPSPNKIMPIPTSFYPGQRGWQIDAGLRAAAGHMIRNAPARYFIFRQTALPYKPGATYILTFKVKGKAQNIKGYVGWVAKAQLGDNKVTRGERGSATVQHNELWEQWAEQVSIPTNPAWTEVRKEFTIKAKDKSIQALPNVNGLVQVSFGHTPGETIYFDDFKVTPKD